VLELRPYQRAAIDGLYDYWATKKGNNPLIVAPTGSGKSLIIAHLVKDAMGFPGTRVLMLTHVKELLEQNATELLNLYRDADVGFYSASLKKKALHHAVTFAGIQSIHKRAFDMIPPPDLVIVDECFTGETKVLTSRGHIRIDQVSCGDVVLNQSGYGVVHAISCKPVFETYRIETDDGQITECTGNHPFFTERGWIKASEMVVGEGLFGVEDMRVLWEGILSLGENEGWKSIKRYGGNALGKAEMLLHSVCKEIQPDIIECSGEEKNQQSSKGNSSFAYQTWRKRAIAAFAAISSSTRPRRWVDGGTLDKDECRSQERDISKLLQGRYSKPGNDDGHRTRRREPHIIGKAGAGSKKSKISRRPWVVNISRIKREIPVPVFNIQVSGHPSYFANGVAVHNCHLIPRSDSTRYNKFLSDLKLANPAVKIVGLTATPYRLDSGWLHKGEGAIFDGIAYDIPVADLMEQGFLAPVVSKAGVRKIDLSNVGKRGGEFIESELAKAASDPELVRETVAEIVQYGSDRKAWLIFACGVIHANMIRDEFQVHGIEAHVVTGADGMTERAEKIERFRRGAYKCLINVNVLTTGFNVPHVDLIGIVRATESAGLYVQIVGRGTRLAPGKTDCLVLDYGDNVMRHGFIDKVKPKIKSKTEDGEAPCKECPSCQTIQHAAMRNCVTCGYAFPPPVLNHGNKAYSGAMISTQVQAEWVDVDDVGYSRWRKEGKPDSIRVTYYCGLIKVSEWLCPDHGGYAAERYIKRMAALGATATTTEEAITECDTWIRPSKIKVKPNDKFYDIVQLDYSKPQRLTEAERAELMEPL
jgi:DNA repair protein RadD